MIADLSHVVGQLARPLVIVDGALRVEKRLEWRLGVDDDGVAAGQADDEIRPQPPGVGQRRRLLLEVAVLEHAGQLDDAAKLDLAPATAHPGRAEGADERLRLVLQLLLRLADRVERRAQAGGVVDAAAVGVGERRRHLRQRVPDRCDERVELLLALAEVGGGQAMDAGDLLVGELEELARAGRQDVGGEGVEGVAQLLLHLADQREALGQFALAVGQLRRQPRLVGAKRRDLLESAGPPRQPAQREADGGGERDQQDGRREGHRAAV